MGKYGKLSLLPILIWSTVFIGEENLPIYESNTVLLKVGQPCENDEKKKHAGALKHHSPIALRIAKTLLSFGRSECNRVKHTF